jgi:hypothetical protein
MALDTETGRSGNARSAGPLNKRVPEPLDAPSDILFDTNGIAKLPLHVLVSTVYPSYKLEFLGAIIPIYKTKCTFPRGQSPSKLLNQCLQVVYFKQLKPNVCPGITSDVIAAFFVPFCASRQGRGEEEVQVDGKANGGVTQFIRDSHCP